MIKVTVPYPHIPSDFSPIHLAVAPRGQAPGPSHWRPALRDTENGQTVVWARFPAGDGDVWLRDRSGARKVGPRA